MTRSLTCVLSIAVCPLLLSCSNDSPNGPSNPPPVVAPQPALSRLVLEGNLSLASVGETSQLKAMAQYADGSSADVSSQARWFSQNPLAIAVSQQGLISVVRLGNSSVSAQFQGKFVQARAIATPPGTLTISGQVREPGQGGGIGLRPSGVRVFEPRSGTSMMTDADGLFTMGGLTSVRVRFERDEFEPRELDLDADLFEDVPMQRIVRISAGDTVSPVPLAPFDVDYTMNSGEPCVPCRLIRVDLPASGTLHLRLKWTATAASLGLWVNGVRYVRSDPAVAAVAADVSVSQGQRVIFVQAVATGSGLGHLPFTLETSYTP